MRYFIISFNYVYNNGRSFGFNDMVNSGNCFPSKKSIEKSIKECYKQEDLSCCILNIIEISKEDFENWDYENKSNEGEPTK